VRSPSRVPDDYRSGGLSSIQTRRAASEANAAGEHVMQYNARKQQVIREIYHRAFAAAGLLEP